MIGIVVLSHGEMAAGMLHSIQFLSGEAKGIEALCLKAEHSVESFDENLRLVVSQVDEGDGVLIFTDVSGGTPANRALRLAADRQDVEVIAGMNLPMLLEAAMVREFTELPVLCGQLMESASMSIVHATQALRKNMEETEADGLDDLMG